MAWVEAKAGGLQWLLLEPWLSCMLLPWLLEPWLAILLRLAQLEWEWMEADLNADDVVDQPSAVVVSQSGLSSSSGGDNPRPAVDGILSSLRRLFSPR